MSNKQRLICVTGPDGSGKSTLIDALASEMDGTYVAGIWDALRDQPQLFSSKKAVDDYLCSLTPQSRTLFLSHALRYSIDKAMASQSPVVLLNAYCYKYFAMEAALGSSRELINMLITQFPVPDVTIFLELPFDQRVGRKQILSRYECGGSSAPSIESFKAFQLKCDEEWKHFLNDKWIRISTEPSPHEVLRNTLKLIGQ